MGAAQARAVIRQYEFYFPKKNKKLKKHKGKKKLGSVPIQDKQTRKDKI